MAHYESLKGFVQEVAHGNCIPIEVTSLSPEVSAKSLERFVGRATYYMEWYDQRWRSLEIYRDLNYRFYNAHEDGGDLLLLMERSGLSKVESSIVTFDMTNSESFEFELRRFKVIKLLELMYVVDGRCCYEGCYFTIRKLIDCLFSLLAYAQKLNADNTGRVRRGKVAKVQALSLYRLGKILNLKRSEIKLIDLFVSDLNRNGPSPNSGVFMVGREYYIIPSHIMSLSVEKVVDHIMVRKDVFINNEGFSDKGYFFESLLRDVIEKSARSFYKLNQDIKKGIPEIDGMFNVWGSTWVLCEAKCSVKPECRRDAYQFTENHIVGALSQLDKRFDFLSGRLNPIPGFVFEEADLLLLIVTNHNYFTGLNLKTPKGRDVYVVDLLYLSDILIGGFVPVWSNVKGGQSYVRSKRDVANELISDAIKYPLRNLLSVEVPSFQIQESGIVIRIHKESIVDDMSFYS
ncbi:hypothetical protein IV01_17030 [Pseudomonas syringae]|uniref:Uncharacterized protein n=2 Tax=Pseudomonas syringae TaxID=317 RepID=A0A085VFJ2_PSESX|nr:hypothetical protein IV01_17030 [Pseudomonas syringae]